MYKDYIIARTKFDGLKNLVDINQNDLHTKGYEDDPHVTVLYGLSDNPKQRERVIEYLKTLKPFDFYTKDITIFETPNFDVIKLDVSSTYLEGLNKFLRKKFDYRSDHPNYTPHLTIAYVKKGTGHKYIKKQQPRLKRCDEVFYSMENFNTITVSLTQRIELFNPNIGDTTITRKKLEYYEKLVFHLNNKSSRDFYGGVISTLKKQSGNTIKVSVRQNDQLKSINRGGNSQTDYSTKS